MDNWQWISIFNFCTLGTYCFLLVADWLEKTTFSECIVSFPRSDWSNFLLDDPSYSSQTENFPEKEIFIKFPRFTSSLYLTYFPCGSMCSPRPTGHIHWGCLAKKALQDSHIQHPAFKLHSASSWYFSNIWNFYIKYTLTFFSCNLMVFSFHSSFYNYRARTKCTWGK